MQELIKLIQINIDNSTDPRIKSILINTLEQLKPETDYIYILSQLKNAKLNYAYEECEEVLFVGQAVCIIQIYHVNMIGLNEFCDRKFELKSGDYSLCLYFNVKQELIGVECE